MFESLRTKADLQGTTQDKEHRLRDLLRNLGINVKFSAGFNTEASFDGSIIRVMHPEYLEKTYGLVARDAETVAVYLTAHEAAHALFSNNDVAAALGPIQQKYMALGYDWSRLFLCIDLLEDAIVDTLMAKKYRGVSDYQEQGIKIVGHKMFKGERLGHPAVGALHMYQTGEVITQADPHVAEMQEDILQLIKRTVKKNAKASKKAPSDTEAESIELYHILYGKPDPKNAQQTGDSDAQEGDERSEGQGRGDQKSTQSHNSSNSNGDHESDTQKDGDTGNTGADGDTTKATGKGTGTGEDTDAGEKSDATGGTDGSNSTESASNAGQLGEDTNADDTGTDADVTPQEKEAQGGGATGHAMPAIPKIDFTRDFEACGDQYTDEHEDYDGRESGLHVCEYQYSRIKGAKTLYNQMEKHVMGAQNLQVAYARVSDTQKIQDEDQFTNDTDVRDGVANLTRRLKQVLQHNQNDYTHKMVTGTLDTRALVGLSTNNTRVFKQKNEKTTGGIAVSILLDASGSMCGSVKTVGQMAYIIAKSLMNHGIATKVAYHRTSRSAGGSALLVTLKDWEEQTLGGLNAYWSDMDNRDDVSLYLSGMELAMRPEPVKLLLVLSDGRPADGVSRTKNGAPANMYGDVAVKNCNAVVQTLRKAGIPTVGVYWTNTTFAAYTKAFKYKQEQGEGDVNYTLESLAPLKRIYGDDFMICNHETWKQFPTKLVRAIANVLKQ